MAGSTGSGTAALRGGNETKR